MESESIKINLRGELKKYKYKFCIVLIIILKASLLSGIDQGFFYLKNNSIRYCYFDDSYRVSAGGPVVSLLTENDRVYYLRTDHRNNYNNETFYFAGILFDERRIEVQLNDSGSYIEPAGIELYKGVLFILLKEERRQAGQLFRVDFNSKTISSVKNIIDFTVFEGVPVILENSRPAQLSFSGINIPLAVRNPEEVFSNFDGRTVSVKGGRAAEIVDLKIFKSVYRYSLSGDLVSPEDAGYNMILRIEDDKPGEKVFYNVYINGIDTGRTETGPGEIPLKFKNTLRAGSYNRVEIERWTLNRTREKYERENNIRQPDPLKLYFPDDAVLYIQVVFSNGKYRVNTSLLDKTSGIADE